MRLAHKVIFFLNILLAIGTPLAAQEKATTATTPPPATAPASAPAATAVQIPITANSTELRQEFHALLHQRPPELSTILALDPTLLSNDAFLSQYPELAKFVAEHPQVRQQSRFYVEDFEPRQPVRGQTQDVLDMIGVGFVLLLLAFASTWVIRTVIDQRRWSRLSRTQTEVHTRILERFGTSAELLEYMRTPAGTKFLESAPIPLHADRPVHAPVSRVLWSIQAGVIITMASLGLIAASYRFADDGGPGLFALGAVAFCIGIGFILSAVISLALSKRLGIWPGTVADEPRA